MSSLILSSLLDLSISGASAGDDYALLEKCVEEFGVYTLTEKEISQLERNTQGPLSHSTSQNYVPSTPVLFVEFESSDEDAIKDNIIFVDKTAKTVSVKEDNHALSTESGLPDAGRRARVRVPLAQVDDDELLSSESDDSDFTQSQSDESSCDGNGSSEDYTQDDSIEDVLCNSDEEIMSKALKGQR